MNRYAKWARANLPESESLSDSALQSVSDDVSLSYQWMQAFTTGILIFLYLTFLKDPVVRFFEDWEPWQSYSASFIVLMIFVWPIHHIYEALIRRRLRAAIISRLNQ